METIEELRRKYFVEVYLAKEAASEAGFYTEEGRNYIYQVMYQLDSLMIYTDAKLWTACKEAVEEAKK